MEESWAICFAQPKFTEEWPEQSMETAGGPLMSDDIWKKEDEK